MRTIQENFKNIFGQLNEFIDAFNEEAHGMGSPSIPKQTVQIVGQTALLLADLPFPVTATMDLDVVSPLNYIVQKRLSELLLNEGMRLENDGHLIWMPQETLYQKILDFPSVEVFIALPEAVMASKLKFHRLKDQKLIQTYLKFFPEKEEEIRIQSKK
ncbi:MAG TPA: hypothetical protein DDW49_02245 [Deltaproteobacteria bacterium]|nr:MAG: hypothetical protein A2048_06790 [Deltaproteobacteria bacterium GWA2_45_12]HBF12204.1 hypothetical protein [Deltaproteobacteria bacterium]